MISTTRVKNIAAYGWFLLRDHYQCRSELLLYYYHSSRDECSARRVLRAGPVFEKTVSAKQNATTRNETTRKSIFLLIWLVPQNSVSGTKYDIIFVSRNTIFFSFYGIRYFRFGAPSVIEDMFTLLSYHRMFSLLVLSWYGRLPKKNKYLESFHWMGYISLTLMGNLTWKNYTQIDWWEAAEYFALS